MSSGSLRAVAFDCYGTLLRITDPRRPYSRLAAMAGGRLNPSPMTAPLSLAEVVAGNSPPFAITSGGLEALHADLDAELASIVPEDEAMEVLSRIRRGGYLVGIVSNLAAPYAEPVRRLLGHTVDVQIFSFEVGAAKPSQTIYHELCRRLAVQPKEVLMIGDSLRNDYQGALTAGLEARHLTVGTKLRRLLRELI